MSNKFTLKFCIQLLLKLSYYSLGLHWLHVSVFVDVRLEHSNMILRYVAKNCKKLVCKFRLLNFLMLYENRDGYNDKNTIALYCRKMIWKHRFCCLYGVHWSRVKAELTAYFSDLSDMLSPSLIWSTFCLYTRLWFFN